ncbi:DUF1559 domain-containing protein [bacterium]|nr:DUF1559 domain-containing protein [bacterium]
MFQHSRRAFTLIELLVVVAIVAVLVGLLLPAVQKVRAAAARSACSDNLRQIALAAHHYESTYRVLPPGYLGPVPETDPATGPPHYQNQFVGMLVYLLPFVEQENLLRQLEAARGPGWNTDVGYSNQSPGAKPAPWYATLSGHPVQQVAATAVKTFRCPAATPDLAVGAIYLFHQSHYANGQVTYGHNESRPGAAVTRPGGTNYLGVAGMGQGMAPWWKKYEGVFGNRTRTTLPGIPDGTSNTLFVGETCGLLFYSKLNLYNGTPDAEFRWEDYPPVEHGWVACGALVTDMGLAQGPWSSRFQFGSNHAGVVQFAIADGSVRALRPAGTNNRAANDGTGGAREWWVFQAMAGRTDGEVIDPAALGG